MVVGLIGMLALISAAYCFWLMTIPLSYEYVYIVVIGFAVSLCVFVIASISSFICVIRLHTSGCAARNSRITPAGKD